MDRLSQPSSSVQPGDIIPSRDPQTNMNPSDTAPLEAVITRQATINQRGPSSVSSPPILLRRLTSVDRLEGLDDGGDTGRGRRRRSTSTPQRQQRPGFPQPDLKVETTAASDLPIVVEEHSEGTNPQLLAPQPARLGRMRAASNAARSIVSGRPRASSSTSRPAERSRNYESDVVDILDVIGKCRLNLSFPVKFMC